MHCSCGFCHRIRQGIVLGHVAGEHGRPDAVDIDGFANQFNRKVLGELIHSCLRCQVGWVVIVLEDHGAGHAPNVDNMGWVAVSVASSLHEQPQAGKSK